MSIVSKCENKVGLFFTEQDLKKNKSDFLEELKKTPLKEAVEYWLNNLHPSTKRNYSYYITNLMKQGIIASPTVGHFNCIPHESVVDFIKTIERWSEGFRQLNAACYISLTSYLNRISQGWFRKAIPSALASNKTFFQVRDKCATEALTIHEWNCFIAALSKFNYRDSLIAKAILQGAKRVSEVLSLKIDQIDFEKRIIDYTQSKTGGTIRKIPITYPQSFISNLKDYIEKTQQIRKDKKEVFITREGKQVYRTQLNYSFFKASNAAGIQRVTPHVLRASWVTIAKTQGVPDSEIMKVTGHTSSKMIYAYDKSSAADNYSKKLVLI